MEPIAIDLFAGAGGFGLGFEWGGFNVPLSLEIDQWAADTLRANRPDTLIVQEDIQEFDTPEKIRELCPYSPDVIIGGPPCQGFSISGPAQKDPKDPRNTLFRDFARWVEILEPKAFVMENVKGLLSRRNVQGQKVIEIIRQTFETIGYTTDVWLLNAAEYGVPQTRERVFVVGSKCQKAISSPQQTHLLFSNNGKPQQIEL